MLCSWKLQDLRHVTTASWTVARGPSHQSGTVVKAIHDVGGPGWTICMQSASGKLAMIESSPRELAPSIKSLLEAVSGECRMTALRKISQIGFWWMSDNGVKGCLQCCAKSCCVLCY